MDSTHTVSGAAVARWNRLADLFDAALARPASDREAYLQEQCGDSDDLSEVRGLLAAANSGSTGALPWISAVGSLADRMFGDRPVNRVGPYELLHTIGHGGMGVVYLARRADGAYQRLVALKLARAPVANTLLRDRFLAERDILAGLAHPNIATLFDGGVTDDGHPYFTMEYVEGRPIDRHCDAESLDITARIRLFLRICDAVSAAHRALVVHRDLKPGNILVTAAGDVKLLDFGIAKLVTPQVSLQNADDTAPHLRLLTPAYASPEQVTGEAVSTATDVYALGLVLYELLTGRRAQRVLDESPAALEHAVLQSDPAPMSAALFERGDADLPSPESVANARRTTPSRLCRQLEGDLGRIVAKALCKEPDRRYGSAAQLAEDLERYLNGHPVAAHAPSIPYRASKFARRNRVMMIAASIAVIAVLGYVSLAIRHKWALADAVARERLESARAQEVANFVVGLFEASDPDRVQDRTPGVTGMLDEGLQRADALSAQPALQARLLNAIGRAYFNLGRFDAALPVAERALAASRRANGDRHPEVARDHRLVGLIVNQLGKPKRAVENFRVALAVDRETQGESGVDVAADLHHLGYSLVQSGALEEGEAHITRSLAMRESLLGPMHEDVAMSMSGLAYVRNRQGRPREAAELYRRALAVRVARLGERHPEVARGRQNLATTLTTAGDFTEAEAELTRALEIYRAVYGERHPSIATTLNNLGTLMSRQERETEAASWFRKALEMRRGLLGDAHPSTLLAQANLGATLSRIGRLAESETMLRQVLSMAGDAPGGGMGISRPGTMANLASVLRMRGRLHESESMLREALVLDRQGSASPLTEATILGALGRTLTLLKRYDEAGQVLRRALAIRMERLGDDHPDTRRMRGYLAELSRHASKEPLRADAR